MKRISIIPVAVLAFTPLTRATAQEHPPPIESRARARSSIVLQSGLMLPLASVTPSDPSPVMPSRMGNAVRTGAIIGAIVGGGVVLVVIIAECSSEDADCSGNLAEAYGFAGLVVVAGAAAGAIIGVLIGGIDAAVSSNDSQAAPSLNRLRVSLVPQRDGRFGLGLSVRF